MTGRSDEDRIRDVVYRYARGVDRRDWDLVRGCYHEDATDWHGEYRGDVDGLIEDMRRRHATIESSMHFIAQVLVEVSGDTATSESYCQAFSRTAGTGATRTVRCRYLDRWTRGADSAWRIADRVVVYESIAVTNERFEPPPAVRRMRRDRGDQLYALVGSMSSSDATTDQHQEQ